MIRTLPVTILIEGIVVYAYAVLTRKPAGHLLLASLVVNLFTQSLLWIALGIFHRQYLAALLIAEGFIWLVESLLMHRLSRGELNRAHAILLSLGMNLASAGLGWLMPL